VTTADLHTERFSPRLLIAVGALLFSTGGAAIKFVELSDWQIASFRSGVAALVLLAVFPAARRAISWRTVLVGTAYAATLVLYVLANRRTTAANAIYLQTTSPFFLVLLAPLLLKEPLRRREIPVLLAVVVGLVLVMTGADAPRDTAPDPATGNLLALGSGLSYAFLMVGLRWLGRETHHPMSAIAAVIVGNLIAFFLALPFALPVLGAGRADILTIGYLGAIQIALAYVLVTRGLRRVTALEAALLLLIETALNPIWAWAVLGETPSTGSMMGGVVIIGATVALALHGGGANATGRVEAT
jgi:DME family drug/metabolite transporter